MLLPLIQTFHLQNDTHVIPNLLEHDTIINSVLNGNIDIGFTELTPEIRKHKQLHMLPFIRRALSFICAFRRSNYDGDTPTINSV